MRTRHVLMLGLAAMFITACGSSEEEQASANDATASTATAPSGAVLPGSGTVLETMDGGGYTYVKADIGGQQVWAAGPQVAVKVGDQVSIAGGMEMRGFESKTLNRTFDSVYFVSAITPGGVAGHSGASTMAHSRSAPVEAATVTPVERVEGGQTVEEIVTAPATWSGKEIAVRGHVVKFNGGIMGKNWIHLQDGTGAVGTNDLTITTDATVAPGDVVVVRGAVSTDRDFGSGYHYDVIVEDASVTKE